MFSWLSWVRAPRRRRGVAPASWVRKFARRSTRKRDSQAKKILDMNEAVASGERACSTKTENCQLETPVPSCSALARTFPPARFSFTIQPFSTFSPTKKRNLNATEAQKAAKNLDFVSP